MTIYPNLVQNFLEKSADHLPNKVALICENRRFTYAEIETSANHLANALIDSGIKRGDRFVICMPNSTPTIIGIFGALKAGAAFVVINAATKLDKVIHILNDCQATAVLLDSQKIELAAPILQACPDLNLIILSTWSDKLIALTKEFNVNVLDLGEIYSTFSPSRPAATNIDLDLACLIYTSGSTGEPKGVMCDHSNVVFAASSIIHYLENTAEDIVINALPLSFDYGLYQLLMVFKFGGTLVLERSFTYPAQILKRIEQEKVTGFPGVPTVFSILLRMDLSSYDLSNLRYITNTAAALPPSQIQQLCTRFPQTRLFSMYGLTETKRTLFLPPEQISIRPASVGIPIPGTEAWIEDEGGNRVVNGEIGELVVRGRNVMRGYWRDEVLTAERFRPGPIPGERLCYTGDLFRMDEDGFFYFIGRKDDIMKCRGEKVAPLEIENVLYRMDGVLEAAVVGIKDPILGETPKAYVVTNKSGLTETAVLAYCRQYLEDFLVPRCVEFIDELPKTSSGKIDKKKLAGHEEFVLPYVDTAKVKT